MTKRKRTKKNRMRHPDREQTNPLQDNERYLDSLETDPLTGYTASLKAIQGYQATKNYICPECNDIITKGSPHLVIVPIDAPDLRRHWHNYCWIRRQNRIPASKRRRRP